MDMSKFAAQGIKKEEKDKHLEKFLAEHLGKKSKKGAEVEDEKPKEKTREEALFDIPDELKTADNSHEYMNKVNWLTGLAEVSLPVEYKIKNIEETEKLKKAFLEGEEGEHAKQSTAGGQVVRKAFGNRFMNVQDRMAESKVATDDAVLERFRKRARNR